MSRQMYFCQDTLSWRLRILIRSTDNVARLQPNFCTKNNRIMHDFENCKSDLLSHLQGNLLDGITVTIVVQNFCGLKVLKVLVKEV